jgi:hypothetical protein
MAFHYGFMHLSKQNASVKIGPLKCKGYNLKINNGPTCETLKEMGQPSGYYIVEKDDELHFKYTYIIIGRVFKTLFGRRLSCKSYLKLAFFTFSKDALIAIYMAALLMHKNGFRASMNKSSVYLLPNQRA